MISGIEDRWTDGSFDCMDGTNKWGIPTTRCTDRDTRYGQKESAWPGRFWFKMGS